MRLAATRYGYLTALMLAAVVLTSAVTIENHGQPASNRQPSRRVVRTARRLSMIVRPRFTSQPVARGGSLRQAAAEL
jgi:hypothetical protein